MTGRKIVECCSGTEFPHHEACKLTCFHHQKLNGVLKQPHGLRQHYQSFRLVAKGSTHLRQCRQDLLDDANFEVFPIPIMRALVQILPRQRGLRHSQ